MLISAWVPVGSWIGCLLNEIRYSFNQPDVDAIQIIRGFDDGAGNSLAKPKERYNLPPIHEMQFWISVEKFDVDLIHFLCSFIDELDCCFLVGHNITFLDVSSVGVAIICHCHYPKAK